MCVFIIYKYTLISLYTVTCVYDFKAEDLALDNHFGSSSLGKTVSLGLGFLGVLLLFDVDAV